VPESVIGRLAGDESPEARRTVVLWALEQEGGNVTRAASRLGISRQTFWHHLRGLGMNRVPTEIRERLRRTFVVD
jgi:transcriptional regulator of acetoin/glycerol metabolism